MTGSERSDLLDAYMVESQRALGRSTGVSWPWFALRDKLRQTLRICVCLPTEIDGPAASSRLTLSEVHRRAPALLASCGLHVIRPPDLQDLRAAALDTFSKCGLDGSVVARLADALAAVPTQLGSEGREDD